MGYREWKNCLVAWQVNLKEKRESHPSFWKQLPTTCNLSIWHSAFGYSVTQNDINIWDQSPLQQQILSGSFPDFPFEINSCIFHQMWFLVDGIYPECSRFVKSILETEGGYAVYGKWQECCCKDIKHAFVVLQRKFQILKRLMEQWILPRLNNIVMSSILLHNMMVEHHVVNDEHKFEAVYNVFDDAATDHVKAVPNDETIAQNDVVYHSSSIQQSVEAINGREPALLFAQLYQQGTAGHALLWRLLPKVWATLKEVCNFLHCFVCVVYVFYTSVVLGLQRPSRHHLYDDNFDIVNNHDVFHSHFPIILVFC
jgi:hypothetical protein